MIKRINKIKNLGVFSNYIRNSEIRDFEEKNIIYGWNFWAWEYTVHPNDIMMMFKANIILVAQKDDTVNAILALIVTSSSCDIPYIRPLYDTISRLSE